MLLKYFVILPSPFSTVMAMVRVVDAFIVFVPERRIIYVPGRRTANIRMIATGSQELIIKGEPADHDMQTCCLGFMRSILWLNQTKDCFFIKCVPDTDVTKNSYDKCSYTAGYKKMKLKINK